MQNKIKFSKEKIDDLMDSTTNVSSDEEGKIISECDGEESPIGDTEVYENGNKHNSELVIMKGLVMQWRLENRIII